MGLFMHCLLPAHLAGYGRSRVDVAISKMDYIIKVTAKKRYK